jgi:FKBP-type peptidyl-prolyl cis-trans isomerase
MDPLPQDMRLVVRQCRSRSALLILLALVVAPACNRSQPAPRGTIAPPDVAAPPPEATVTPSGLAFRVLASGPSGGHPGPNAVIVVNYTGWTTDGTIVEGAPVGSPPVRMRLSDAMPGLREGLHLMRAGDKYRFWIPPALAYGNQAGKPHGMLVYDIHLVRFVE